MVGDSIRDVAAIGVRFERCEKPAHPRIWRPNRVLCGLGLSLASGFAQGCYVYTPLSGRPAPATYIALDITDRGRVGLGDLIGPAATRVEGVVTAETDSIYSLSVAAVGYMNGQENRWSGEPLTVRKDFIGNVRERKFSRARTFLASGGAVGGILFFALTRGLFGFGGSDGDGGNGDPEPQ